MQENMPNSKSNLLSNNTQELLANLAHRYTEIYWYDVVPLHDAIPALDKKIFFHAGPPLLGDLPFSIMQAATQAILYEGFTDSESTAHTMLLQGDITLVPAQDYGVVTPLAQVVSGSMPVAVVGDNVRKAFAPLVESGVPALRFGNGSQEIRASLQSIATFAFDELALLLRQQPIQIAPIIAYALEHGDECHGRTNAANLALVNTLHTLPDNRKKTVLSNPGFVLPIMMAASCWLLGKQTEGIAAVGGNGIHFGLRMHGSCEWRTISALPPVGMRTANHANTKALGAIGDSAVIDFCGLGGQILDCAPTLYSDWNVSLPQDWQQHRLQVCNPNTGLVDPALITKNKIRPFVNLAILDEDNQYGLIGRGTYSPDLNLFL